MSSRGGGDSTVATAAMFERNKLDYEDMRLRLLETEEKLLNLRRLEEEVQSVNSETTDRISSVSNYRSAPYKSWHEDTESESSALSTLAPGSYTGFARHQVAASTPSKKQPKSGVQSRRGGDSSRHREHVDSDSSTDSTKENRSNVKYERKLLLQNQRLLVEVERLIGDLHSSKIENASLLKETESVKKIPDLEERIEELTQEAHAQDKALREAERHLELGSKRNSDLQKQVEDLTSESADLREEVHQLKETRKTIESQRDESIQNLLELQESWEDYQRRSKEKQRKMEEREDSLQDGLTAMTGQRDDLLEQMAETEATLASQEAQINGLLRDVELEESLKHQAEEESLRLKTQLDQLTAQINEFERNFREGEAVRQEKLELEKEVNQHRIVAHDVRELVELFQKKQNYSHKNDSCAEPQHDLLTSAEADLNRNNNGLDDHCGDTRAHTTKCSQSNNISEIRHLFSNMDSEIQRLRTDLKERESDDKTYMNLRQELTVIMQKAEKGMTQNTELECICHSLEQQKKVLECKLDEAVRALEERVTQSQMLDTRLSERNRQVVCLQEDVQDKSGQINSLEALVRDLRKKLFDATSPSTNTKAAECEAAMKRVRELEDALQVKEASLAQLQIKYMSETKDLKAENKKLTTRVTCMTEQVNEFQRQLDQMTTELSQLRQELTHCSKEREDGKRKALAREDLIKQLQAQLDEDKITLHEKDNLCEKLVASVNKKLESSEQNGKELNSALIMCKNEVAKHLATMDEVRRHFENQITQKDAAIKSLTEQLRKAKEDTSCKEHEVKSLEHSVMTLKSKVEQVYKSLQEAENCNLCLNEKLKQCEKRGLSEKACCLKEMEELERKLSQALHNLQIATGEIGKLKQIAAEKSSLLDCCNLEKNSLSRDLSAIKQKLCEKTDLLNKMEKDNTELCTQLQHKMDCIKDLEQVICNKDHDLKNCTRCLDDLNKKFLTINSNKGDHQAETRALVDKLKNCTDDLLKKNRLLVECEEQVKRGQMEVQSRQDEIDQLKLQLNDLNCKLQGRIIKVEELERAIECIHKDTEKRMKRVDEQLRRYECELSEKVRQLTDMDECLATCKQKLTEKVHECCQAEQRSNRLCCDLQAMEAKYKDLEEAKECCNRHLNEAKGENAEITQQLRVTREELQTEHCELVDTRNSLINCNKEVEKLRRQIDDCQRCLDTKDCELKKCSADRNELLTKVANLQCRLEQEGTQHQQKILEYKSHVEKEMVSCRSHNTEIEEKNCMLTQKLSSTTRHLQQVEKAFSTKLDGLNRELEDLLTRLADREDQISLLRDQCNKKEAELMKLKMRLCTCENTTCNNNSDCLDLSIEEQDILLLETDGSHQGDRNNCRHEAGSSLQGEQGDAATSDQAASSSTGPRNSLGVSEVQERLRSNQRLQIEIEKQLRSLEDDIDELPRPSSATPHV